MIPNSEKYHRIVCTTGPILRPTVVMRSKKMLTTSKKSQFLLNYGMNLIATCFLIMKSKKGAEDEIEFRGSDLGSCSNTPIPQVVRSKS